MLATIAVALGVGYLAGALSLLDRVSQGLSDMAVAGTERADLIIEGEVAYESAMEQTRRLVPASLAEYVVSIPGVATAVSRMEEITVVLDATGEPVVAPGLSEQPLGMNWPDDDAMSVYEFVGNGRPPTAAGEVVLDEYTAQRAGVVVGDSVVVAATAAIAPHTVVGIVTTESGGLPDGSSLALFETGAARSLFSMADHDNRIAIRVEDGADVDQVQRAIAEMLPPGAEIVDGVTGAEHRQATLNRSFALIRALIVGFAGLALVVGMVTVSNSLSLMYAQRRRTFATFRLLGTQRYQLLIVALIEAALLAVAASVVGLPLGVLLGMLIEWALSALGTSIPTGGSIISISALLTAAGIGVIAAVLAACIPAWRAARVSPLESIVTADTARQEPLSVRALNGVLVAACAAVLMIGLSQLIGSTWTTGLILAGAAVVCVVLYVVVPPMLAGAVSFGIRLTGLDSPAVRHIAARDTLRHQGRTAATTAAMLFATAVVIGLSVFLASFTTSIRGDVDSLIAADLVVDSGTFTRGGLPADLLEQLRITEGVEAVSGWFVSRGWYGEYGTRFTGIDGETLAHTLNPDWVGSAPTELSPEGVIVEAEFANTHNVTVGSYIAVTFTSGGVENLLVEGIYSSGATLLGDMVMNRAVITRQVPASPDIAAIVALNGSGDAVRDVAQSYGISSVLEPSEFVGNRAELLRGFERVIQWMLVFTLVQALVGIVNTLLMSVDERRQQFGLLRIAGATPKQLRSMVLMEGISFSVIGTALGILLGIVGAAAGMAALESFGLSGVVIPVIPVVLVAVVAMGSGILATVIPARLASVIPPLEALADSGGQPLSLWQIRRGGTAQPIAPRDGTRVEMTPAQTVPTPEPVVPTANVDEFVTTGTTTSTAADTESSPFGTRHSPTIATPSGVLDGWLDKSGNHDDEEPPLVFQPDVADDDDTAPTHEVPEPETERDTEPVDAPTFQSSSPRESEPRTANVRAAKPSSGPIGDNRRAQHTQELLQVRLGRVLQQLDSGSRRVAQPLLLPLAQQLKPQENVVVLIQGWTRGNVCVVARTTQRIIVLVERFPEPFVEHLDLRKTTVTQFGPPRSDRMSLAIVQDHRLLEVTGVRALDMAQDLVKSLSPETRNQTQFF